MSNEFNKGTIAIIAGAVIGIIMIGIGAPWAMIHGLCELGQEAFTQWTWEPLWYQTLCIALAFNLTRALFSGGNSNG